MLLCIDAGNSDVTLGLFGDGGLGASRRAATATLAAESLDQVELMLEGLLGLDHASLSGVDAVSCASVVPAVTDRLRGVTARRGIQLVLAGAATVPFPVRVDRPAEVGPDRLVNALAAQRELGAPVVVVDLGTAITIDAVAPDGAFVGGIIAPGPTLGLAALAGRTALLPRVELEQPPTIIGSDTASAIQAGVVGGTQALVSGLVARVRSELARTAGVGPASIGTIMTGGHAATAWARSIDGIDAIDPLLTLKGLAYLYAEWVESQARTVAEERMARDAGASERHEREGAAR